MAFNGLRNAGLEIKNILGSTGMKVALVAIAIIPCLYGVLYLAAFFDPYGSLDEVPVAIVNLDEGAEINGEERNVGEEVCEDISSRTDGLQWNFVSEEEANAGMEAGDYYMICTIPADFSEKIASADSGSPEAAKLSIEYNESKNMLASKIGQSVWEKIQNQISDSITRQYWNTVLTQSDEAGKDLEDAASSSEQLSEGTEALEEGNSVITEGISALSEGSSALETGLSALATGSEALVSGVDALVSGGSTLSSGASALATGTSAFASQASSLTSQTSLMASGAQALDSGLQSAVSSIGSSNSSSSLTLAAASQAVTDGLDELASGLSLLQDGTVTSLEKGLSTTKSSLDKVSTDLNDLADTAASGEDAQKVAEEVESASSSATAAADDADTTQTNIQDAQGSVNAAQEDIDDVTDELNDLVEAGTLTSSQAQNLLDGLDAASTSLNSASDSLDSANSSASSAASSAREASTTIQGISGATAVGISEQIKEAAETIELLSSSTIGESDDELVTDDDDSATVSSISLFARLNALSDGLDTAQDAIGSSDTAGTSLAFASNAVTSGLDTLGTTLSVAQDGSSALYAGSETLAALSPTLVSGIESLDSGAQALALGISTYVSGTSVLSESVPTFVSALASTAEGTSALTSGADALATGSSQMGEALSVLGDSNQSLADQLSEGASDMRMPEAEIETKADMMSSPVELDETYYSEVDNYATGFAPYFMAIGLWVGCLVAGFAIRPLDKRLVASGANPFVAAFSGFVPLALFAIVQSLILMLVLQFGLGLQIEHIPQFYAFGMLVAVAFAAIMQLLVAAFGFPGRFVAIILLVLQLASCAGTFPIETTPAFFQVISPFMPMTYVVEGMRQLMTGVGFNLVLRDTAVLAGIAVGCFLLTALVAYLRRFVRMVDLHPVLKLG